MSLAAWSGWLLLPCQPRLVSGARCEPARIIGGGDDAETLAHPGERGAQAGADDLLAGVFRMRFAEHHSSIVIARSDGGTSSASNSGASCGRGCFLGVGMNHKPQMRSNGLTSGRLGTEASLAYGDSSLTQPACNVHAWDGAPTARFCALHIAAPGQAAGLSLARCGDRRCAVPPRPVALHLVDSPCSILPRCAGFSFGRSTYASRMPWHRCASCIGALACPTWRPGDRSPLAS